jgi:hypothetical protein
MTSDVGLITGRPGSKVWESAFPAISPSKGPSIEFIAVYLQSVLEVGRCLGSLVRLRAPIGNRW